MIRGTALLALELTSGQSGLLSREIRGRVDGMMLRFSRSGGFSEGGEDFSTTVVWLGLSAVAWGLLEVLVGLLAIVAGLSLWCLAMGCGGFIIDLTVKKLRGGSR